MPGEVVSCTTWRIVCTWLGIGWLTGSVIDMNFFCHGNEILKEIHTKLYLIVCLATLEQFCCFREEFVESLQLSLGPPPQPRSPDKLP